MLYSIEVNSAPVAQQSLIASQGAASANSGVAIDSNAPAANTCTAPHRQLRSGITSGKFRPSNPGSRNVSLSTWYVSITWQIQYSQASGKNRVRIR